MASFKGPWSQDLDAFKKSVQSMPEQYRSSFASASKDTLEKLCDPTILHVWESDSDIDNLLQLTSIVAKLCNLGPCKDKGAKSNHGSMVIIVEERGGRNNFSRICQLIEYLTGADGKEHLEGTVNAFETIVVVKGWNNSDRSDNGTRDAGSTVKRITTCIERAFKMGSFPSGKKKIVWHHGAVVHSLLHFLNDTTSNIRSSFHAITITGSLDLEDTVKPSPAGRANTLLDLTTLESYAKRLDVPVVFFDPASQCITSQYLATYMYYYAYYINTFLPSSLSRAHLHKAQDEVVTFAFQIFGASTSRYGDSVVRLVKEKLGPRARKWARACVDARSYEKTTCRKAGKEDAIHHAVQLTDSPFALFHQGDGLPAFARLAVGPTAHASIEYHIAAPVHMDFQHARFRPASPATFFILTPASSQGHDKVTNQIQGLMMAVLERVRQEKGNPTLNDEEKSMWSAVVKACTWALENSKGKMPKPVEEKVKFVREKLVKGTWSFAMGVAVESGNGILDGGEGLSDAARANRAAAETYGVGGNMYGQPLPQPQQGMGYVGQGQMGVGMGFGDYQAQQQMMNQAYRGQQGVVAPPNSPGVGQALPMGGQHFGAFAAPHGGNGRGGYSQSMGGNWL